LRHPNGEEWPGEFGDRPELQAHQRHREENTQGILDTVLSGNAGRPGNRGAAPAQQGLRAPPASQ
jgi:hypothetical protein